MVPLRAKVGLLLLLAAGLRAETRRALVIGINTYEPPAGEQPVKIEPPAAGLSPLLPRRPLRTGASFRNLGGAVADARSMSELLTWRFGFRAENVRRLEDRQATRAAILESIRAQLMPPEARAGDVSVFFYAGHGSQVFNSKSREEGHLDESLVPADAYRGAADIRDKELGRLFNDILDRGIVLTVIVDSCHSGSIARGQRARSRAMEIDPRDANDPGDTGRASAQERGALILSSTQKNDEAKETLDGQHGAFTWALTKVLSAAPPDLPVGVLFQEVRSLMQSQATWQEPVLAGADRKSGVDRSRLTLLGKPAREANTDILVFRGRLAAGHVLLEGALAAALSPGCEVAHGPVRLRVVKVLNLNQVEAEVVQGDVAAAGPEAAFELARWVVPPADVLRILAPPELPRNFTERLHFGPGSANEAVQLVTQMADDPQYVLEQRSHGGAVEYALAAVNGRAEGASPLPARTDWETAGVAARKIEEYAARIQRIRGWLQLASPPGSGPWPYQLGLRNVKTGKVLTSGTVVEDEEYRLVLQADPGSPGGRVPPRYVYVFTIDGQGKGTLLYPAPSTGTDGNRLPVQNEPKALIELGEANETVQVSAPFGVDTYVLLTTQQPLPYPGVLNSDGVETGGGRRGMEDPLASLLAGVGGPRVRGPVAAPAKWAVFKTQFRSVGKTVGR